MANPGVYQELRALEAALKRHVQVELAAQEVCEAWRNMEWADTRAIGQKHPQLVDALLGLLHFIPGEWKH